MIVLVHVGVETIWGLSRTALGRVNTVCIGRVRYMYIVYMYIVCIHWEGWKHCHRMCTGTGE